MLCLRGGLLLLGLEIVEAASPSGGGEGVDRY